MLKKCKIYFDGSHYIALPLRHPDEETTSSIFDRMNKNADVSSGAEGLDLDDFLKDFKLVGPEDLPFDTIDPTSEIFLRIIAMRRLFEDNYSFAMCLSRVERITFFKNLFREYIDDEDRLEKYIMFQLNRKFRNFVQRRLRCLRKLNLTTFNYFCTFTYNSKKLSEEDFRKSFSYFIQNKACRDGWKYIGVWERGSETERLHFHCLLSADPNTLPGENVKKRKWSSKVKRMISVVENTYLAERFGGNDFSPLDLEDADEYVDILNYLVKYIEKSGERLVYSRGLAQYLECNVDYDEDVAVNEYDRTVKMVLFDDFMIFDENNNPIGQMSKENERKMKKRNF